MAVVYVGKFCCIFLALYTHFDQVRDLYDAVQLLVYTKQLYRP